MVAMPVSEAMKLFTNRKQLGSFQLRSGRVSSRFTAIRPAAKGAELQPQRSAEQDAYKLRLLTASAAALVAFQGLLVPCALADGSESRIQYLKGVIQKDFVDNQYYVTGKLTKEAFEPNCLFTDPTTRVEGKQNYKKA